MGNRRELFWDSQANSSDEAMCHEAVFAHRLLGDDARPQSQPGFSYEAKLVS